MTGVFFPVSTAAVYHGLRQMMCAGNGMEDGGQGQLLAGHCSSIFLDNFLNLCDHGYDYIAYYLENVSFLSHFSTLAFNK